MLRGSIRLTVPYVGEADCSYLALIKGNDEWKRSVIASLLEERLALWSPRREKGFLGSEMEVMVYREHVRKRDTGEGDVLPSVYGSSQGLLHGMEELKPIYLSI